LFGECAVSQLSLSDKLDKEKGFVEKYKHDLCAISVEIKQQDEKKKDIEKFLSEHQISNDGKTETSSKKWKK